MFLFQMKLNYLAISAFLTMTGRGWLQIDNMGLRVSGNDTPFINTGRAPVGTPGV